MALPELIGRSVFDLPDLGPYAELIAAAVAAGAVDTCTSRRSRMVTRVLEVDGGRDAATVWQPSTIASDGWAAASVWPEAAPMALGYVDPGWCVTAVGAEVESLLGHEAAECPGRPLGDLLPLEELVPPGMSGAHIDTRLDGAGADPAISVLLAPRLPDEPGGYAFALVGEPQPQPVALRVAELEQHLLHIGAEVRAAGVALDGDGLPEERNPRRTGPLDGLTSRQWEIVDALLEGKRVPRIARDLFLSQSTVRNHLAALFRRFGVHSQPELIERLRGEGRGHRVTRSN